jgi:hypothetical protein
MHRPQVAVCGRCVLWHREKKECRADPPGYMEGEDWKGSVWPNTEETDWCGGFNDDWDAIWKKK